MTHREKALWAAVTALLFSGVAIGLLIWFRDDYTRTGAGPSVIAAMAIGFAMATYSSRETTRYLDEKRFRKARDTEVCAWCDHQPHVAGEPCSRSAVGMPGNPDGSRFMCGCVAGVEMIEAMRGPLPGLRKGHNGSAPPEDGPTP